MSKQIKNDQSNSSRVSASNDAINDNQKSKAQLKAERKAAFEAQRSSNDTKKGDDSIEKSKSQLKAERRAKQELERAKKASKSSSSTQLLSSNTKSVSSLNTSDASKTKKIESKIVDAHKESTSLKSVQKSDASSSQNKNESRVETKVITSDVKKVIPSTTGIVRRGQIFAHLPQKHNDIEQLIMEMGINNNGSVMHPKVIQIGLRFNKGIIKGSNGRCVAMLIAFKKVIHDYITPPSKELARDLESNIDLCVKFLAKCRPLSISMVNAVKFVKLNISKIPAEMNDHEAKSDLCTAIDNFISDEIICAQRAIADIAITKIRDYGDVILTFGCSLIVKHVLYTAMKKGKKFRIVVVDSRPHCDGKEMLKYLLEYDIPASYIYINAVSYVMKEVTKVLLGAHGLLANGYVMSHLGTSQIALVANAYNVPVLVCCETYKFSERVHTDSFVHNELGDSRELINSVSGKSQESMKELNTLDLLYDVTPPEFVSVVITEIGVLPCTSAPAVLRFRETK